MQNELDKIKQYDAMEARIRTNTLPPPMFATSPVPSGNPSAPTLTRPGASPKPLDAHDSGSRFGDAVKLVPKVLKAAGRSIFGDNAAARTASAAGDATGAFLHGAIGGEKPVATSAVAQRTPPKPSIAPQAPALGATQTRVATTTAAAASPVSAPARPNAVEPASPVIGSFTGSNGIARQITAEEASLLAGQNGAAVGTAPPAPVAAASSMVPSIARPSGQAVGAVIGIPGEDRRRLENDLIMARGRTPNTRSGRASQAEHVAAIYRQHGQAGELAAQDARARIDAQTRLSQTGMQEAGANQRQAQQAQASRDIAALQESGQTTRELSRPQYIAGADGTQLAVTGALARPVLGADGKPVRAAGKTDLGGKEALAYYTDQAALIAEQMSSMRDAVGGPDAGQLAALQKQYDFYSNQAEALLAGNGGGGQAASAASAPPAGTVRSGYRFKGGDPADRANWEKAQ